MNILVSYTNVHKNVSSSEEFNNQIDRIAHSLDSSPVFQPLITLPNDPTKKVVMASKNEAYAKLQIMEFQSLRLA